VFGWGRRRADDHNHVILESVRGLSWDGYSALIADLFRRNGLQVFAGEGPDQDVIDIEVTLGGAERMLVNYQLRGMTGIDTAPLEEMALVAERNGACGAFLITDGEFSAEARSFAAVRGIVLVDGRGLLELVLELTLAAESQRRFGSRLAKLLN
jgi:restriction system protein